jgi:hypothetical protein
MSKPTALLNTCKKEILKAFRIMAAQEQLLENRRSELNGLLCNQQCLTKEEIATLSKERELIIKAHVSLKAYCLNFDDVHEALSE